MRERPLECFGDPWDCRSMRVAFSYAQRALRNEMSRTLIGFFKKQVTCSDHTNLPS